MGWQESLAWEDLVLGPNSQRAAWKQEETCVTLRAGPWTSTSPTLHFIDDTEAQRGLGTCQNSPSKAKLVSSVSGHWAEAPAMTPPHYTLRRVTTGQDPRALGKGRYLWVIYPTLSLAPILKSDPEKDRETASMAVSSFYYAVGSWGRTQL